MAAVSGARVTGAASCRQQHNRASCQPPLPEALGRASGAAAAGLTFPLSPALVRNLPLQDPFFLAGGMVTQGGGEMLVTGVGESSCEGKLSAALEVEKSETPLQEKLEVCGSAQCSGYGSGWRSTDGGRQSTECR